MYRLYHIINKLNNHYYIGVTKNSLSKRFSSHKYCVNSNRKTALYDAMRKYGIDNFYIVLKDLFDNKEDCFNAEMQAIKTATLNGDIIYNLSSGGEGGFFVGDIESWKAKLRIARIGKKPFLRMKHSSENKKLFSICSEKRFGGLGKKYTNVQEILKLSYKDAIQLYGISQTHYYRLKKLHQTTNVD